MPHPIEEDPVGAVPVESIVDSPHSSSALVKIPMVLGRWSLFV